MSHLMAVARAVFLLRAVPTCCSRKAAARSISCWPCSGGYFRQGLLLMLISKLPKREWPHSLHRKASSFSWLMFLCHEHLKTMRVW